MMTWYLSLYSAMFFKSIKGPCSWTSRARTQPNILRWKWRVGRKERQFYCKLISFWYIIQAELSENVTFLLKLWFFIPSLGFSTYILCYFDNNLFFLSKCASFSCPTITFSISFFWVLSIMSKLASIRTFSCKCIVRQLISLP